MKRIQNFIQGRFLSPSTGRYLEKRNPSTNALHCEIPDSSAEDIAAAVKAARAAFPGWSTTSARERSDLLYKIADAMEARKEEFARAESEDQGKPFWLSLESDLPRAIHNFRVFAGLILHQEEMATDMDGRALNYTRRAPLGVAGLIVPWNLPLYTLTFKLAPALATGNTVVAKPSELTPSTAQLLAEVLSSISLPPGVVNIVHGAGASVGTALTAHPDVPLISFTGSTATAGAVQSSSAPFFKKLSLELGGKNATVVFADADLDAAVKTSVRAAFLNQGEICLCGSRILVERKMYPEFLKKFVEATRALKVGDPFQKETFLGPLVTDQHRKKVMSYIEMSRSLGGKIETGGNIPSLRAPLDQGYFLEPTVITGLDSACAPMQEEIFGPVVTITPFDTEGDAVALANGTRFGLSASLWTRDLSRAHRVAALLEAGYVWVNCWVLRDTRTPFGGVKHSGLGREGGRFSLDFYTELKTVCVQL